MRPDPVEAGSLSCRARALLRAVQVGRGELICGRAPHLLIDRLHVCDQDTAALTRAGLIAPAIPGAPGMRVLAQLTDAGRRVLGVAR